MGKLQKKADLMPARYALNADQVFSVKQYEGAVKLLIKAGYPAKFCKFWVKEEDESVGYISIGE